MTLSNIMSKIKLHRVHSARAGDENFNNKFYWSILYKNVYLRLEDTFTKYISSTLMHIYHHITLQPKTGCPQKLSRAEPGQYLDGRPPGKTRLLLEEVLVRPAGGAHPVVCVGPNAPV